MKKLLTIFILSTLLCSCSSWTKADLTREGLWSAAHIIDWKQTRYAMEHPERFKELNPALGDHPSEGRINTFMGVTWIGHILISHLLKDKKKDFQNITLGAKIAVNINNYYVGAEVEF